MKKIVVFVLIAILGIACLSSCEQFFHTHTYEIKECPEGHFKSYTCGCELEVEVEEHIDENGDGSCDICTHKHTTDTWKLKDGHKTVYTCGCESLNVMNNHVDEDGDYYCDVCYYYVPDLVELSLLEPWLLGIKADEVAAVRTMHSGYWVLEGKLKEVITVTEKGDIADIIESYRMLKIEPLDPMVNYDISNECFRILFVMNSGETYMMIVNGGFMFSINRTSYNMGNAPEIGGYASAVTSYMLNVHVGYNHRADVYSNGEKICQIENVSGLEFVASNRIFEGEASYTIETGVGILEVYSECFFVYEGKCYELINNDFYKLIEIWSGEDYSLTMSNTRWLYGSLKSTYKAGETVYVQIKKALDIGYLFLVNGEKIDVKNDRYDDFWIFEFVMPAEDTVIEFYTYDGFVPNENYAILCESYILANPGCVGVCVEKYYGEFESGAIVAMMGGGAYTDALWDEVIDGIIVHYYDGNRILVLYEGDFYTLTEAYEAGYLTRDDISDIAGEHNKM